MPGVPSGRGCETCRNQKKKCDLKKPACSRCCRLRIRCKGAGEQRYKFLNVGVPANAMPRPKAMWRPHAHSFLLDPYCQIPTAESTLIAQDLVARLGRPSHDIRYHMTWVYGLFLGYLPSRLGHNSALDAATRTLLDLHTEACTYAHTQTNQKVLRQYSAAIKAVREVLNDPTRATETEALAAVVILGCCQARFDGPLSNFTSTHGVGAAQLLKMRPFPTGHDDFENLLLLKIRGNMAIQAAFNSDIKLSVEDWRQLEYSFNGSTFEARLYRCATGFGQLVPAARIALADRNIVEQGHILANVLRLQAELEDTMVEIKAHIDTQVPTPDATDDHTCTRGILLRAYGCALAFEAMLLCVQRALSVHLKLDDKRLSGMCSLAYQLVHDAEDLRPLGSTWVTCMLMSVWCAAHGSEYQMGIEEAMHEFQCGSSMNIDATASRNQLEAMYRSLSLVG